MKDALAQVIITTCVFFIFIAIMLLIDKAKQKRLKHDKNNEEKQKKEYYYLSDDHFDKLVFTTEQFDRIRKAIQGKMEDNNPPDNPQPDGSR